ncbi:MAG: hypothetical protein ACRDH5_03915, partial [bacterium]
MVRCVILQSKEAKFMSPSGLRRYGALLLVALTACPATMAESATSRTRSTGSTSLHASKSGATAKKPRRAKRRSGRRAPPGGVVWARNAIALDPTTGTVLFEKNAGASAPCASLTKLMTALVFLEQRPEFPRSVEVTNSELLGGGHT